VLTRNQRGVLITRLLARWKGFASYSRAAHMRDLAAGQIETPERACAGAQGNLLQNVIGDVEDILCGIDPIDRRPLVSPQETAYVVLHHAVAGLLQAEALPETGVRAFHVRKAAIGLARHELSEAFKAVTKEAPIAPIEAALACEESDG